MEQAEILSRAEALFASEGWPVIVQVLKDVDEVALATIRAQPENCDRAASILADNENLRNTLRHVSRLLLAQRAGLDINEPIPIESLPEHKDVFDV